MELQATLDAGAPPLRLGAALRAALVPLVAGVVLLAAWHVHRQLPYTSGSEFGYWLGVVGGSLMAGLLLYPLRKRFRVLGFLGPLRHWFRLHLVGGIAGPLVVLFHSTFRVGSFNAAVALASMLLVVASGLVGRFLYRHIHNGLFGSRASLTELQQSLQIRLAAVKPLLTGLPGVEAQIERFSALAGHPPAGWWRRTAHFLSLGTKRLLVGWRVRRAIAAGAGHADLHALADAIDAALRAAQRTAQFSTYERLFSLWHVIHLPFLVMLVITAIVHVVAVHAY